MQVISKNNEIKTEIKSDEFQIVSYGDSLGRLEAKYFESLDSTSNPTMHVPQTYTNIRAVVGAIISAANLYLNKLRNGTDLQKTEYKHLLENKKYIRIRTSRGQIARYAGFFWSDSSLGTDAEGKLRRGAEEFPDAYESAKKKASKYIKTLLDDLGFIVSKRKCNENGFGGLELYINREWLVTPEIIDANGRKRDYIYPQGQASSPQSSSITPLSAAQNGDLQFTGIQKVTEKLLPVRVLTLLKDVRSNKKNHNRDVENVDNPHSSGSASHDAEKGRKREDVGYGESSEISLSRTNGEERGLWSRKTQSIPPRREKFPDIPSEMAHWMPDDFFAPQRYQSLHLRGTDMYRTAHQLMNIFYHTVIPAAEYEITGWEYRNGIDWMEDLLVHAIHSDKEKLTLEQGFLKMTFCINILLSNQEESNRYFVLLFQQNTYYYE